MFFRLTLLFPSFAPQTLVRGICDAVLSGSAEKRSSADFFGLVHSNTRKTGLSVLPCKGNYLRVMQELESMTYDAHETEMDTEKALKLLKVGSFTHERPTILVV